MILAAVSFVRGRIITKTRSFIEWRSDALMSVNVDLRYSKGPAIDSKPSDVSLVY